MSPRPGPVGSLDEVFASVERLLDVRRKVVRGQLPKGRLMAEIKREMVMQAERAAGDVAAANPSLQGGGTAYVWVVYKQRSGFVLPMKWYYLADANGPGHHAVMGPCPECYHMAPTTAAGTTASKPVIVNQTMMMRRGNPEADKKLRVWRYDGRDVWLERSARSGRLLLTVGTVIRCLDHAKCGFSVEVVRGEAHYNNPSLVGGARRGEGKIARGT